MGYRSWWSDQSVVYIVYFSISSLVLSQYKESLNIDFIQCGLVEPIGILRLNTPLTVPYRSSASCRSSVSYRSSASYRSSQAASCRSSVSYRSSASYRYSQAASCSILVIPHRALGSFPFHCDSDTHHPHSSHKISAATDIYIQAARWMANSLTPQLGLVFPVRLH
jgi:hypothetical protein